MADILRNLRRNDCGTDRAVPAHHLLRSRGAAVAFRVCIGIDHFTGRTEIWAWVMSAIEREPVLGNGFATTQCWIPEGYQGPYGWTTTSAHNMWLQAWITTGAIGAVLVILSQLASLATWSPGLPAPGCFFAFVTVVGLMEAGALGPSVNLLTFFWLWAAGLQQSPTGPGWLAPFTRRITMNRRVILAVLLCGANGAGARC